MKRIALVCLIAFGVLPRPANAIQILENVDTVAGFVVSDTLTIGITAAQLNLGPISGFFVNLILFPLTGPQPEITLFEIDLLGAAAIAPDHQAARWVFATPITSPTTITSQLNVDFHGVYPAGTEATYGLSSLDANFSPIETLEFSVPAPVPEPSTKAPSLCLLLMAASGRILRARRE